MALNLSTGLINGLLSTGSAKAQIEGGAGFLIDIYTGSRPASANSAATGTRLLVLSNNGAGTGMNFAAAAVNGQLDKLSSQVWSSTVTATGTAGWFRIRRTTDTGTTDDVASFRADGVIATSGGDLNLTNTSLVTTEPFVCNSFALKII
jgi:hypothetical protein